MRESQTTVNSRSRKSQTFGSCLGTRRGLRHLPASAVLAACALLAASSLRADTVYLKDGTQIVDCKVKEETETHVYLQTPVGDMGVPKTEIYRIQRTRSVYDTYKEQLSTVPEGDVGSLFRLALWCRSSNGLRKESDELLLKVIALRKDHAQARRLLGHLKVDEEWFVPEPLSIRLKISGSNAEDLRTNLGLFLATRKDVRLESEAESKPRPKSTAKSSPEPKSKSGSASDSKSKSASTSDPKAKTKSTPEANSESSSKPKSKSGSESQRDSGDAVDLDLDGCTLTVSVSVSRRAPITFYGRQLGQPVIGATIRFEAHSPWIGKTALKTSADGQVPESAGNPSVAIQNALGSSGTTLHKFLDQLTGLRVKKMEEEFRKKERAKKAQKDAVAAR